MRRYRSRPPTRARGRRYRGGRRRASGGAVYRTIELTQTWDMNSGRTSTDNKYVSMYWLHQLARNDATVHWVSTSNVIYTSGVGANREVLSVRQQMQSWRPMFRYARLMQIGYKFEWLGNLEETVDGGNNTDYVRRVGPGETIWYSRCHEQLNRGAADNANLEGLAPANVLGLMNVPRIVRPDVYSFQDFGDEADVPWAVLSTDRRVKKMVFTQEKPMNYFVWKPITRMDKIAATWDLDNIYSAEHGTGSSHDDDQRCGAIGFYHNTLWQTGLAATREDDLVLVSRRLFRVTAYIRFKIFGMRNVMRQVTINGIP